VAEFRPVELLATLAAHNVRFVLIGGMAAAVHGSEHVTFDVDITPDLARTNLDRLSRALTEMGARIRTDAVEGGLPFEHSGESLARAKVWNLTTEFGDLDLAMLPAGTDGYDDLARDAVHIGLLGVDTVVASLADVIRSKEAADRPKDRLVLPNLRRALEEQQRRAHESD
jgi:hypothetical protein